MSSRLIDRLKRLIDEHAASALTKPAGKSEFDYGHACGTQVGLRKALQAIEAELSKDEEDIEDGVKRRAEKHTFDG